MIPYLKKLSTRDTAWMERRNPLFREVSIHREGGSFSRTLQVTEKEITDSPLSKRTFIEACAACAHISFSHIEVRAYHNHLLN
jgi:hypothetical protein